MLRIGGALAANIEDEPDCEYRLPREVRSVKVVPIRKAPTMEELATATQRKVVLFC